MRTYTEQQVTTLYIDFLLLNDLTTHNPIMFDKFMDLNKIEVIDSQFFSELEFNFA